MNAVIESNNHRAGLINTSPKLGPLAGREFCGRSGEKQPEYFVQLIAHRVKHIMRSRLARQSQLPPRAEHVA